LPAAASSAGWGQVQHQGYDLHQLGRQRELFDNTLLVVEATGIASQLPYPCLVMNLLFAHLLQPGLMPARVQKSHRDVQAVSFRTETGIHHS
jgi:hypothetical protein